MNLSKLDVARSQLLTAIRLYWDDGDPVSVYTLASNAWEIIYELCRVKNIDSISDDIQSHIGIGKKLKRDYINKPFRNFFKHADTDHDDILNGFSDSCNDGMLYMSVEDFIRLSDKSPLEFQVYQLWYLSRNPDKLRKDIFDEYTKKIELAFPEIRSLTRSGQKKMAKSGLVTIC